MLQDRRRVPRAPVAIKVEPVGGGPWMIAHDISLDGMLVTSPEPKWPGQLVRIRFRLPGETRAICATCRVLNLAESPRGVGLTLGFLRLHPEARLALHRHVDQRPLEPGEEGSSLEQVKSWVQRMIEDCGQLLALARSSA